LHSSSRAEQETCTRFRHLVRAPYYHPTPLPSPLRPFPLWLEWDCSSLDPPVQFCPVVFVPGDQERRLRFCFGLFSVLTRLLLGDKCLSPKSCVCVQPDVDRPCRSSPLRPAFPQEVRQIDSCSPVSSPSVNNLLRCLLCPDLRGFFSILSAVPLPTFSFLCVVDQLRCCDQFSIAEFGGFFFLRTVVLCDSRVPFFPFPHTVVMLVSPVFLRSMALPLAPLLFFSVKIDYG